MASLVVAFVFFVKMAAQDLTCPVAANQLAASFFLVKMTPRDLTSPVAAVQLTIGAFVLAKITTLMLLTPQAISLCSWSNGLHPKLLIPTLC